MGTTQSSQVQLRKVVLSQLPQFDKQTTRTGEQSQATPGGRPSHPSTQDLLFFRSTCCTYIFNSGHRVVLFTSLSKDLNFIITFGSRLSVTLDWRVSEIPRPQFYAVRKDIHVLIPVLVGMLNPGVEQTCQCDCPACRTTLIATRFWVVMICPIIKCLTVLRVFFYFVWFVFIHHNFQFYFELCTYCNILDIYLS